MSAYRHPWWIHWRGESEKSEVIRHVLVAVLHEHFASQMKLLIKEKKKGMKHQDICQRFGWERWDLSRLLGFPRGSKRAFEAHGGLPAMFFVTFCWFLDVGIQELFLEPRELLTRASTRLIALHHPDPGMLSCDPRAYVEYYLQLPDEEAYEDELVRDAVRRTFARLDPQYSSEYDLAEMIHATRTVIDSILDSL